MSMATALTGVPLARAFTTSSVQKPRSAQSVRRAPLRLRAQDPAAPDKAQVKDEVVDCESASPCQCHAVASLPAPAGMRSDAIVNPARLVDCHYTPFDRVHVVC